MIKIKKETDGWCSISLPADVRCCGKASVVSA